MINFDQLRVPLAALFSLLLAACGGGGGGEGVNGGAAAPPAQPPIVVTPMVEGGDNFSFALMQDGTVIGVGHQQNGTLGDGEFGPTFTDTPRPVLNIARITQVASGDAHSIARRDDGAVFVWGANGAGQLGIGQAGGAAAAPVQLGLSNIIAVAAGGDSSYALRGDGVVFAWGNNVAGQLGLNDGSQRVAPVQIPNLSGVTAIAAGGQHVLAIRNNGTVFAWGNNLNGQLGLGVNDTTPRDVPTHVVALDGLNVRQIVAGEFHSLALAANGTMRAWGSNSLGECGNGFGGQKNVPVQVLGLTRPVTAIAAGNRHSLALLDNETMRTWGSNTRGQLGNGTSGQSTSTDIPQIVQVNGGGTLTSVAAIGAGKNHSLVITADGSVGCFGDNFSSECGQPSGFSTITRAIGVGSPVLNVNQ